MWAYGIAIFSKVGRRLAPPRAGVEKPWRGQYHKKCWSRLAEKVLPPAQKMASSLSHAFQKILNHGHQQSSQPAPQQQQQQQQQQWSQPGPPPMMSGGGSSNMRTVGYFPSWSIYDRGYKPQQVSGASSTSESLAWDEKLTALRLPSHRSLLAP